MCLFPRLIRNPKYRVNKKNKGVVPIAKDQRVLFVPIGCGMCMECLKKKANQWKVRLSEDIKRNEGAKFITLTFSNESYAKLVDAVLSKKGDMEGYALDNAVAKIGVRRFLERWRKKYKKSIRHWLITELGHQGTENIHLHGLLWTNDLQEVEKIWGYGWIWKGKRKGGKLVNYVSTKTINYITKYVTKVDLIHKYYKPIILTSPGIGKGYTKGHNAKLNKYKKGGDTKETYTHNNGFQTSLPIYYRNKLYTEEEREQLWLEKLDKQQRWVNGIKIDVSQGEEGYESAVKEARKLNKELGFGDPYNWDAIEYERQRRQLKQIQRYEAGKKKYHK